MLLAAWFGLLLLGWLGIARSEQLAGGGNHLRLQITWSLLAGFALLLAACPSYRAIGRAGYLLFGGTLALLVSVYFFPTVHGTHRWLRLAGLGMQPSEFTKVTYVLALARWLMYRDNYRRFRGMFVPLVLTLLPVILILREPDLGTSLVFLPLLFVMLFAAGARPRDLAMLAGCGLLCLPILWTQMSREQRSRVTTLFHQNRPEEKPTDDGYHLHQAKQLLALGGVWGSLLAGEPVDDPAVYHLPEDHTDFIFIVLCERLGWLGAAAVLGLVTVLAWRALAVAEHTQEPFGRLVVVGVAGLFGIQALINTGMTVGLLPVTGLSLPLVSYGGSGLVAHSIALGLVVNVSLRPGYELAGEPFRRDGV
jgi:rod shape determining protein RodA